MNRRVVVTGLGCITPVGLDVVSTWESLVAGRSGAAPVTLFDASELEVRIACEVKGFVPTDYFEPKEVRRLDRSTQFALVAAQQVIQDAHLEISPDHADRIGVIVGTGIGGIAVTLDQYQLLQTRGSRRLSPFGVPMMMPNAAAGQISINYGLKGPCFCIVAACATGNNVIGEATEMIRRGSADVILAGGTESPLLPLCFGSLANMGALSRRNDDPARASRPFDARRDGFVAGEGAAMLVLEELERAKGRGANIYAEIVGYGATADAFHITAPAEGGEGAVRAMRAALQQAGVRPEEVDYINAHGTSTLLNDRSETRAIKTLFGDHAYRLAISSTKSMVGHTMGAAGVIEGIATVLTLKHGIIHPTINYEFPDPECDLDYVPNVARRAHVRYALSNSFGFGGHNACVLFKRYE